MAANLRTFPMTHRGGPLHRSVWAVVPIKEAASAKERLAKALSPGRRQELAVAMFEDVMQALSTSNGLAGIAVVTVDQKATQIAARWGADVWTDGARDGHTGAVTAAARRLAAAGSGRSSCTLLWNAPGPGAVVFSRRGCALSSQSPCREASCEQTDVGESASVALLFPGGLLSGRRVRKGR